MATQKPFRVIFVGGGLVSITAAHMFSNADIDFVILEQHNDLTPQIGSVLTVFPPTMRIFDQLGLLDTLRPVLHVMKGIYMMFADNASVIQEKNPNLTHEKNHGWGVHLTTRPVFIERLYQSLPASAKARIKVNKRVAKVDVLDDGVRVECTDGTVEEGSIVVGSDGTHSRVRQCMQALERGMEPPDASRTTKSPYPSTYRFLFGSTPAIPGLPPNMNYECPGNGASTQIITGPSWAWFSVYEALDKPTLERVRYTEEDKMKLLERWGHLYIAPGWTLREVYARRIGHTGMINLEEGFADQWSWKRIVLVGDAVRKVEPHAGLGYNNGLSDAVALVNRLRRLLRTEASPTTAALEALFADYQKERMTDMPLVVNASAQRARSTTWLTKKDKIMCKYILPYTPLVWYSQNYVFGGFFSRMPVLEWLEEKALPPGKIPWVNHPVPKSEKDERSSVDSRRSKGSGLCCRMFFYIGVVVLGAMVAANVNIIERLRYNTAWAINAGIRIK
ncbi:FAD/NAD(P)-binding domain-containing protein [Xylariaceae sp. FL0662B]|nr:FAD/NAD(P)-binding domain-containing protein [Xylariaceae sp. FL0662B]